MIRETKEEKGVVFRRKDKEDIQRTILLDFLMTCVSILGEVLAFVLLLDQSQPTIIRIAAALFIICFPLVVGRLHFGVIYPLIKIKHKIYNLSIEREGYQEGNLDNENLQNLDEGNGLIGGVLRVAFSRMQSGSEAKALNAEVALYALQSEINPHFLYNALEVIRNNAEKHGISEISDMALALARIFRYSISRPGDIATLADEINNVKNYVKIQQYRFPDKFEVVYDVDLTDDSVMQCKLPVLTLQPVIENALNHGLASITEKGTIKLRAFVTDRKLMISITDTGIGISPKKLEELRSQFNCGFTLSDSSMRRNLNRKTGISLNNVNNRLKIYFGEEYGLSITSCQNQFTTVEIVVPKLLAI